ncbi:uncharacterized protein LOC141849815 [Brevipalpus obovatus]|uniref:uncharacterized protein LOC141849815 n=1 Tax=Brevipalpus obovatus TaxID=246614 RepID=UPI003D9E679C
MIHLFDGRGVIVWLWICIIDFTIISAARKANKVKKSDKIDCLIVTDKGFGDPQNVYQCETFQVCCIEYNKPSCCGVKPTAQIIKEQVILWGGLLAFLIILALIVWCRMNDFYVMESKSLLKRYLPCYKRRTNKVADGTEMKRGEFSMKDMKLHFDNNIQSPL